MATDRLDPTKLRADAEQLLGLHLDPAELVADLLREVRRNADIQEAIRQGYVWTHDKIDQMVQDAESRAYLDAARIVRSMTPAGRTQVTYEGAKGQAVRRLRARAVPLQLEEGIS